MTNFLSSNPENAAVSSVDLVNSDDGSLRFNAESLSSYNFDGLVPNVIDTSYNANQITPGMYFVVPGEDDTLRPVVSINPNDDDPDGEMEIIYLDLDNSLRTYTCDGDDQLTVQYESWDERVLGTQGWGITAGGNALFSNVAVRGEVSAESGDIGGWIIQNKDTDTHGAIYYDASIDIGESGAGVYVTGINTGYGTHYDTWIPEDDDEEDPFHLPSQFYIVYAPGSDPNVAGAKRPRWNSASTTFYVDGHGRFSLGNALTFDSNSGSLVIGGYASSSDLDGYIPDGDAAQDIVTNATTITGGNISTGRINSSGYNGPTTGGGSFSTVGSQFNLDDGTIVAPNFRIDNTGNAFFRGSITGSQFSTSSTIDGSDFGTGRVSIKNSFSGFDGPILEIRNFSTLGPNNSLVRIGMVQRNSFVSDLFFSSQGADFIFDGSIDATSFDGSGFALTNLNPANISAGTAGISITGNAATATTATTATSATSAGGLFGSPSISVNGITNNANGITNNSGQITSLPTYNNANSSLVANQHVTAGGVFRRAGSTQRIKTKITPLNEVSLSKSVKTEKILNDKPGFNYNSILSITPVEYTPLENGEEQEDIRSIGFIAEDIADKTPSIATYDLEGIPEYYNINSIVASMLAVVQDQQKIIEDLQNRVLQLESQLG